MIRFGLAAQLTRTEIRQLREKAAADMRSIGNYVAFLVIQDLRDTRRSARRRTAVPQGGNPFASHGDLSYRVLSDLRNARVE